MTTNSSKAIKHTTIESFSSKARRASIYLLHSANDFTFSMSVRSDAIDAAVDEVRKGGGDPLSFVAFRAGKIVATYVF